MTNAQLIAIIDDYLAQHVLALSDLHANPVWGQVAITIQGQVTIIRRRQTARLIRSLVILEYVGTGLSNGILVPKRGLMYYYIGQLGPEAKSSFPREFKRTVNSLGLPTNLLCSTEPKTLCCGDLDIKNMETGDEFDLLKHCQLDMSIVKGGRYEIVRRGHIERILVIEKASIWRLMVQTDFHKKMNALVITGKGFPSTQCRAWLYNFRIMLSISEENCIAPQTRSRDIARFLSRNQKFRARNRVFFRSYQRLCSAIFISLISGNSRLEIAILSKYC